MGWCFKGWLLGPGIHLQSVDSEVFRLMMEWFCSTLYRFHAIYWPAFLMAAGLDPPQSILCHAHWMINHEKVGHWCTSDVSYSVNWLYNLIRFYSHSNIEVSFQCHHYFQVWKVSYKNVH